MTTQSKRLHQKSMARRFFFPLIQLITSLRGSRGPAPASDQPPELRAFTRTHVAVTTTLLPSAGPIISGYTTDLSMKGLHLVCDERVAVGSACHIMLMEGQQPPESLFSCAQLSIEATGVVTRLTHSGLAIQLTALVGKHSFDRLRTLLLAHAVEADRIEGELQTATWSYETDPLASSNPCDFSLPRQALIKHQPQRRDGQTTAVRRSAEPLDPEE